MTDRELDEVYTLACRTISDVGEDRSELFLCRLALLLMREVGKSAPIKQAIANAREGLA